jgi:hypothetical protein
MMIDDPNPDPHEKLSEQLRQMAEADQQLENLRKYAFKNLPLVLALANHPLNAPINNPALIATARMCASIVGFPMSADFDRMFPEEDE